jgi:formylglycine-generating enzyme required for sulfatase activity/dienelactone hydrolase
MKIGDSVSHYRIVELLGMGGMGVVYKAEDTRLKRAVALKFLPFSLLQDAAAKERLIHEAQAASALDHPNICTIHEIEETADGELFLAMAYYEGETLKDCIARGPLALDEAIGLMIQVARAVSAAHDAGIIHRDVKPANIIVTKRGEAKLVDFGIAKLAGQTALTRTGTTLGTVAYMPPEQLAGRDVDARSDVWALGVLIYQTITGRLPFVAQNDVAMLRAISSETPAPLRTARADAPAALEPIVARALRKEPADRYASAGALLQDLEALSPTAATRTVGTAVQTGTAAPKPSRTKWLGGVAGLMVVVAAAGWFVYRNARVRWARTTALPQIAGLIDKEQFAEANRLLRQIEPYLADDPEFAKLRGWFLLPWAVRTTPPGADVYMKGYSELNRDWEYLGRTPIDTRGPLGYFRWRISKAGFTTFEGAGAAVVGSNGLDVTLVPEGTLPDGMVRIPGGTVRADGQSMMLPEFLLDKFEVTNRAYKKFVDAGGYRSREFWQQPFVKDSRTLSFDDAMQEFRDATGRPGPSTWELATYPDGQDDVPVHGVSWYEANAYARFAGKLLPTAHHWQRAAALGAFSEILEFSNFGGKGPAPVGSFHGIGEYGTYDMAGNVKEWCWNEAGDRRYILGGGWNEPNYQYAGADARLPFDRSSNNGFRLMKAAGAGELPPALFRPIVRLTRDYSKETPVADDVFRVYERPYDYDRSDLKAKIESSDDSSPSWRVERITYDAAYGNERVIAHLFLPKTAHPPYQTVVYFPHSGGFALSRFEQAEMSYLGFIVKAGRALLFPMYKGMYERRIAGETPGPNAIRDQYIQRIKDLRRSLDYLATRSDLDSDNLAYFGVSYGAKVASVALAVEQRFKTAVLWSGGFDMSPQLPEVDPINFAPHVRTPILMLNGRDDFTFPIEESQQPMFRMLGTAADQKQHVLYDGGHVFPFARIEKDTLDWLDKYLGVPK